MSDKRNWCYEQPLDESATTYERVVFSEAMILEEYGPYVREKFPEASDEDIIDHWVVVHWAAPTYDPIGRTTGRVRSNGR